MCTAAHAARTKAGTKQRATAESFIRDAGPYSPNSRCVT